MNMLIIWISESKKLEKRDIQVFKFECRNTYNLYSCPYLTNFLSFTPMLVTVFIFEWDLIWIWIKTRTDFNRHIFSSVVVCYCHDVKWSSLQMLVLYLFDLEGKKLYQYLSCNSNMGLYGLIVDDENTKDLPKSLLCKWWLAETSNFL